MAIFIKENDALNHNSYEIPKNLSNHLKKTLIQFGNYSNSKGYKRLNSLVNPNYNNRSNSRKTKNVISYSDLKRIDHDLRHMSQNPNNLERVLNGGDKLAKFAKDTLNRERT